VAWCVGSKPFATCATTSLSVVSDHIYYFHNVNLQVRAASKQPRRAARPQQHSGTAANSPPQEQEQAATAAERSTQDVATTRSASSIDIEAVKQMTKVLTRF
jgi:hypothetical protein